MSEEPIFDPSLKKRKKKAVTFTEDPLGADADPTAPAPTTIEETTADGEPVDLGPKTTHELMANTNDDMFADLKKKKKKKKDLPMDFVSTDLKLIDLSDHQRFPRAIVPHQQLLIQLQLQI